MDKLVVQCKNCSYHVAYAPTQKKQAHRVARNHDRDFGHHTTLELQDAPPMPKG